jgi:hypothetical protein
MNRLSLFLCVFNFLLCLVVCVIVIGSLQCQLVVQFIGL